MPNTNRWLKFCDPEPSQGDWHKENEMKPSVKTARKQQPEHQTQIVERQKKQKVLKNLSTRKVVSAL